MRLFTFTKAKSVNLYFRIAGFYNFSKNYECPLRLCYAAKSGDYARMRPSHPVYVLYVRLRPVVYPSGASASASSAGGHLPSGIRSVRAPVTKPPSESKQESQYMTCKVCGTLCV